jgi:hypothetical protein
VKFRILGVQLLGLWVGVLAVDLPGWQRCSLGRQLPSKLEADSVWQGWLPVNNCSAWMGAGWKRCTHFAGPVPMPVMLP